MYNGFSLLKEYTTPMNPVSFEEEDVMDSSADDSSVEENNKEKNKDKCCEESLQLGLNRHDYCLEAAYNSYIETKIYNENRLTEAIERNLILTESSSYNTKKMKLTALNESGLGDKIKDKWNKFVKFIKNIFAKFMESMTNILYKQQDYLKKYQKIILNKRPKEDIEYSYTGNYKLGVNRITTLEIPDFNYATMKSDLLDENDDNHNKFIRNHIHPNGYDYDDVESLADSFKKYFIAGEEGSQSGKLSDINMTDLYNFCFNFDKIQKITSKDITHLEKSTTAVINAAQDNINTNNSNQQDSKTESAFIYGRNYFTEKTENNSDKGEAADPEKAAADAKAKADREQAQSGFQSGGSSQTTNNTSSKPTKPGGTGLTLDVSKASGSIKNDQGAKEDKDQYAKNQANGVNTTEENNDLVKCVDNYMAVCRTIITAKWTAAEQIAKDYMAIIRAHVRSYVGNDKDTNDNMKTKQGTKYTIRDNSNPKSENDDQGESADEIAAKAKNKQEQK